jgi:hypothetical protein
MFEASKEQIKEWKAKYGDLYCVRFTTDDAACYLKTPSRKAISYASAVGQKDAMKFNEIILNDSWIAGDEKIISDDSLFISIAPKLAELINIKEAELEKL